MGSQLILKMELSSGLISKTCLRQPKKAVKLLFKWCSFALFALAIEHNKGKQQRIAIDCIKFIYHRKRYITHMAYILLYTRYVIWACVTMWASYTDFQLICWQIYFSLEWIFGSLDGGHYKWTKIQSEIPLSIILSFYFSLPDTYTYEHWMDLSLPRLFETFSSPALKYVRFEWI